MPGRQTELRRVHASKTPSDLRLRFTACGPGQLQRGQRKAPSQRGATS